MQPLRDAEEPCPECGGLAAGGGAGCQALFDALIARDFSDVLYFRVHRMAVDTYALQHPDRYCASAKSLAAHLVGLQWILEQDGDPAIGGQPIRRWLDGSRPLQKPDLPAFRGSLTIASVLSAAGVRRADRPAAAVSGRSQSFVPQTCRWSREGISGLLSFRSPGQTPTPITTKRRFPMKRYLNVLALTLAIFPLLGSRPAEAAERPFKLSGAGTVIEGNIQATGRASHLGLWTEAGTLNFVPDPNDPNRVLVSGEATFTAANGDELRGVITDASLDLTTGIGTGEFRFTGGTGRFADASGSASFEVMQNLVTGAFEITAVGSIDY
jgi:uncharacterized protein DUF5946